MCGIAGAAGSLADDLEKAVGVMNDAQIHRGPDDVGVWSSAKSRGDVGCVLGHRRLSIVDLSPLGHQPMLDEETGCAIVYNGEIYNFMALRDELKGLGHRFASRCDTEVLLRAWIEWGEACLERFEGMFAFALWDPRHESVFLVRDRMGIKPLYYATAEASGRGRGSRQSVFFASELRALLATGRVSRRMDPVALATYLHNGFAVGPHTMVEGVRLLPAGSMLRIDRSGRVENPRRYWSLPADGAGTMGEQEAVEAVRERLDRAIRQRLVADVPLGIFLSGGVDSSAVAAIAQRSSDRPITTFNISFDEAQYDESVHAKSVADTIGSDHREVRLSEESFVAGLPDALGSLDQPTFDAVNTFFVSRAVREAGLTVALAGTGGDELFGGYSSFKDLPRARRWLRRMRFLPASVRGQAGDVALAVMHPGRGVPPQTRWGKLRDLLASNGSLRDLYQVSYALYTERFRESLLSGGEEAAHGPDVGVVAGLPASRAAEMIARESQGSDLHGISQLELELFLGERLLRDTDMTSMAVSLEVRVPLVDHALVEAVSMLPASRRFEPLGRKALLRELGCGGIDPDVFDRPKAGFELPFDLWCRRQLREEVGNTLLDTQLCHRVGLEASRVAELWKAFCDDRPGIYWSRVWALYVLMGWSREHDVCL